MKNQVRMNRANYFFNFKLVDSYALINEKHNYNNLKNELQNNLNSAFLKQPSQAYELCKIKAQCIEYLIAHIWNLFKLNNCNLIAVGGFGRGELHPFSDVDLMILTPDTHSKNTEKVISEFQNYLWDLNINLGLTVGSAQQITKLAKDEITVMTSLLESKCISVQSEIYSQLKTSLKKNKLWPISEFFKFKSIEQSQRHDKSGNTAFNLEPNIKEGPGGMRDIHAMQWILLKHSEYKSFDTHERNQLLDDEDIKSITKGRIYLSAIRYALHIITNKKEERLLFDYQKEISKILGFNETNGKNSEIEGFMQDYYQQVMALKRLNLRFMQLFEENVLANQDKTIHTINRQLKTINNHLELNDLGLLKQKPNYCFEIFRIFQINPKIVGFRGNTIKALREFAHSIDDSLLQNPKVKKQFIDLFKNNRVYETLDWLNRLEILPKYLPDFGIIIGRMQFDLFHAYTVDQHTLFVIKNIQELLLGNLITGNSIQVSKELRSPYLLYLAGLFHDIAKGRKGSHASNGAIIANDFGKHHNLSRTDTKLISWLVQNHLILSITAQKKDIHDAAVINHFCTKVDTLEKLNYLYLLTIADIMGTNPKLWNGFKETLLNELYIIAKNNLQNNEIKHHQKRTQLENDLIKKPKLSKTLATLTDKTINRYSVETLATMLGLIQNQSQPVVRLLSSQKNNLEIFVYCKDFNGVFFAIVNQFEKYNYNVVDAKINSTTNGYALNTFHCLDDNVQIPFEELSETLKSNLLNKNTTPEVINRRTSIKENNFQIATQFVKHKTPNQQQTKIEIISNDNPGLLAKIAKIFLSAKIQINAAKIATYGNRAEDIFWISSGDKKLSEQQIKKLKQLVLNQL